MNENKTEEPHLYTKPIAGYTSLRVPDKEFWKRAKMEAIRREVGIGDLVIEGLKKLGIK